MPKFFLTFFCHCYAIAPIITHALVCCVFPEKLGIIKHDVVFFHFIALINISKTICNRNLIFTHNEE